MNVYSVILVIISFLTFFLAIYAFMYRKTQGVNYFFLLLLSVAYFSFCYAFELNSVDIKDKILWLRVGYVGLSTISVFFLFFILSFAGRGSVLTKRFVFLILLLPLIVLVSNYTNDYHHLFYTSISTQEVGPFSILVLKRGILYWIIIAYTNLFNLIATFLLIEIYITKKGVFKLQSLLILIASLLPWLINTLYVLRKSPDGIDLSAFGFFFTALVMSIAVFHYQLLGFLPIAFDNVFRTINDGVILLDNNNRIINFNSAAKRIFESLNNKSIGKDLKELLYNHNDLFLKIEKYQNYPFSFSIEKNDYTQFLKVKLLPIKDKKEIKIGNLLMLYDVTSQTITEQQLVLSNNTKDKLFSIISNDLRAPFNSIIGLLEILKENPGDYDKTETKKMLDIISSQAQNTYKLLENLLFWSRNELGQIKFFPESFSLYNLVVEVVEGFFSSARLKNISIKYDVSPTIYIHADKEMIKIIFGNLISNSVKFCDIGGIIEVKAVSIDNEVVISVSDNGVGMNRETLSGLFSLNSVHKDEHINNEGTRLGLIICKEFVEKNKGRIWAESEDGNGCKISFTIPSQ